MVQLETFIPEKSISEPALLVQCKQHLRSVRNHLKTLVLADEPIEQIITTYVQHVDQLLITLWNYWFSEHSNAVAVVLIAVGGYGAQNLYLYSDIDLLILSEQDIDGKVAQGIEKFLRMLWDIDLQPSSSVRTINQCLQLAAEDQTVLTNLLTARPLLNKLATQDELAVNLALFANLKKTMKSEQLWSHKAYFLEKCCELERRYLKFDQTAYNLEPNVKSSPGGLRDLDFISWLSLRFYDVSNLYDLFKLNLITLTEYHSLLNAKHFLRRVRWALHMISGKLEDRLLFDYQQELASLFNYKNSNNALAVELFMKQFFRSAKILFNQKEQMLQHFSEKIMNVGTVASIETINEHFQLINGYIGLFDPDLFKVNSVCMMELFMVMARRSDIKGVQTETIRQLSINSRLINHKFRENSLTRHYFLEILKTNRAYRVLALMSNYNLLGAYLPEFGFIIGQMQYDMFHIYTVDAHTLFVINVLCRLGLPESEKKCPLASEAKKKIPKKELLYIAALYHDIGKGRGGDHAKLGAQDAYQFCINHRLVESDAVQVRWLVENHLFMSATAQGKDIYDTTVINEFAMHIVTEDMLDYLYCLTVADIIATNPRLWNGWRATLLRQLYQATKKILSCGFMVELDNKEEIKNKRDKVAFLACEELAKQIAFDGLWDQFDDEYFRCHTEQEILWHSTHIIQHQSDKPLIITREAAFYSGENSTQIAVYTRFSHHTLVIITNSLDREGFTVQDARLTTTTSGYTLSTFVVLVAATGKSVGTDSVLHQRVITRLKQVLKKNLCPSINKKVDVLSSLKHFKKQSVVLITIDHQNTRNIIEIKTNDCPGLLSFIAKELLSLNLRVHSAKISTLGEKVRDVFFVTDLTNKPLICTAQQKKIRQTLFTRLRAFQ